MDSPSPDPHSPLPGSRLAPLRTRWLWLLLAYVSLGIGIVALFIPGIPTTEFVLLSAWAASRGSPRLQRWLEQHRLFGPMIHNWRHGQVVARRAKISASLMMSLCLVIMLFTVKRHWVIVLATLGMAVGAAWMWSRPERIEADNALPGSATEQEK
ncbi:YbaN family protein [Herbaspirillum rubrisubalbicans]|uniref:DUF454 domain-containing protein n=1 Tax=Herbaspirillum rubrisubalbicans TaxID=80842 RepID=A0AAD0XJ79_9BURK|nr:YbaN family protein [Herbaspirillum rubrisubalbicans]ALU91646.1 hypothetical protein Hrubri_4501 [Herbaspirillum rubrisubalbicans M1]AYR26614.1 DUF454 domain-containing protein [Herbaspirillum rubrisubalbicans]